VLEPEPVPFAWEPVTPRGVALFARATTGRLWVVQFIVALIVALTTIWLAHTAWFPTVRQAIQHLPDGGEIRAGRLDWRGSSPRLLAEGTFLAFSVDLEHAGEARSPAHVEVEFGRDTFLIRSLLGYVELPYPQRRVVAFNREELGPWWGAWSPMLLAMTVLFLIAWFLVLWNVLAVLYAPPLWLLAFFVNRDLKWRECWRVAGAAVLPGALLMTGGILMYGLGIVDLIGLAFVAAGHVVLVWIYLFIAPLFLPQTGANKSMNPFSQRAV
jgi:hypothetical protein